VAEIKPFPPSPLSRASAFMTTSLPAPTDAQARAIEASAGAIREAVQALRGLGGYLERVFGTVPEDLVGYFGGDRLTSLFVTDPGCVKTRCWI